MEWQKLEPPPSSKDVQNAIGQAAVEAQEQASHLLNTTIEKAGELGDEAQKNIAATVVKIDTFLDGVKLRVDDLLAKAATATQPPPVDVVKTIEQISEGIAAAERKLNAEGMVVARGKVELLITVQVPGTTTGATSRIEFEITPKPIH